MSDSTLPPQLHLSIPPTTTSFKRSFEQYGFDVDHSPVDNVEGTESNSNGDHSGAQRNERNKRARSESVLPEGDRANSAVAFLPNVGESSTGLGSGPPLHASTATITGVLSTGPHSTSHLHVSSLPPRLPTPEMADMEVDIEMSPLEGTNSPVDTLPTASLSPSSASVQPLAMPPALPIPMPLSLSLPVVDLGLGLEGGTESETTGPTSDNLTRSMERFAAFDSEIDALRRVSPPPPASPPQLPPLQHHRRNSSLGSSSYSSQASTPAGAQATWTSQPPMFLDVPPALFDRPFRGLGVDSDSSAAPSSRNSMDTGLRGYTPSTQPPTLPPIATTSATIWEDEAQSPVSAAATIASSSATATQSIFGEQPTMDLNLPEVTGSGSPLEEDPVRWFLPEHNPEEEADSGAQPGPPEVVPDSSAESTEETTPRHPQVDNLLFANDSDASGEFAALARSYGLLDSDEAPATSTASGSNEPMRTITPQSSSRETSETMEQMMTQALQGFMSRGRDALLSRDDELLRVQVRTLAPLADRNDWAPLRRIQVNERPDSDMPQDWTPREGPIRRTGDGSGSDSDAIMYLSHLRQMHASATAAPSQTSNRSEDSSTNRSFRHPLLQHPPRHQHRPSSLRSSTSLVGESRSERGRMRDELDLGLSLRSEPVAGPSSTSASSTTPITRSSSNPSSSHPRRNRPGAALSAQEREAIEQLNRASELLRAIDRPWSQSARAYVDVATELINSHMDEDDGEMPTLQDVNESDTSDSDEGNDEMDVQMSGVSRSGGRLERLTEALRRGARERDRVMEVDAPRRGSRFSRARIEAHQAHLRNTNQDGDSEVSGEDAPTSQRGPGRRHVHPLLGQSSRPFLPAPALPSPDFPDFDMDFIQRTESESQPSAATQRHVRLPFSGATRTGTADTNRAGGSASPYAPRMSASGPLGSPDVPGSFPAALRRAYHGNNGEPSDGSLSQAMLGYAASGSPATLQTTAGATGSGAPATSSANQSSSVASPVIRAQRFTISRAAELGLRRGNSPSSIQPMPGPSTSTGGTLSSVRRPAIHRLSVPSPADTIRQPARDTLSEAPTYRLSGGVYGIPQYLPPPPPPPPRPINPSSAQNEGSSQPALPVSEMFAPGPYQNTIRMLEIQRAAAAARPPRPAPPPRPLQTSVFDSLDRMEQNPSTETRRASMGSLSSLGRPAQNATVPAGSSASAMNPHGSRSNPPFSFGGSPPRPQPRPTRIVAPNVPTSLASRSSFGTFHENRRAMPLHAHGPPTPGQRLFGQPLGPSTSGARGPQASTSGPALGVPSRTDPLARPDTRTQNPPNPSLESLNRERARHRLALLHDDDILMGERNRVGIRSRTHVHPPQPNAAGGTSHRDLYQHLRRRLHSHRFNLDDFVLDNEFDDSYENLLALTRDMRRTGTPQDVIDTMESGIYKDWAQSDSDTRCPICLDDYDPNDSVTKLKYCPHWMHKDCIQQWLKGATSCPVCRKSVLPPPTTPSMAPAPQYNMRSAFTPFRSRFPTRAPDSTATNPPPLPSLNLPNLELSHDPLDPVDRAYRFGRPRRPSSPEGNTGSTGGQRNPSNPRPPSPRSGGAGTSSQA